MALWVLCGLAVAGAGVAAATPATTPHIRRVQLRVGPQVGPDNTLTLPLGPHTVSIHPPPGWFINNVHGSDQGPVVTFANRVSMMDLAFFDPEGARGKDVVGERDGSPIVATQLGLRWRSPDGFVLFAVGHSGATDADLIALIKGVLIT